ncbi:MAG TPA: hypothetical protein VM345_14415 [Acidimicrobiales bacterium]|nr:hypothetical protein [Acidimicrobiales bacterium]
MTRRRSATTRRLLPILLAAALLASACGGDSNPVEIGFRRIALDLAFKDAEKAPPIASADVIRTVIGADDDFEVEFEEESEAPVRVVRRGPPPPPRVTRQCDTAPEGATPERVAFQSIKDPPKVGVYPRHNEGTLTIDVVPQPIVLPVPELSRWEIPQVSFVRANVALNEESEATLNPPAQVRDNNTAYADMPQFSITRRLLPGYSTTDTYRYTYHGATGGDFLYLVKRVSVARGVETVFEPTPPIRMVRLNVPEGDMVNAGVVHAGVDRKTNMALAVQSQVVSREWVDVCGDMIDTYRVQIKEQVADLSQSPPRLSGNEGDTTNYWNIQFDNGLLIVREQVDSTLRTSTKIAGQDVPIAVHYKYTSTLDQLDPLPLGTPAFGAAPPPRPSGGDEDDE